MGTVRHSKRVQKNTVKGVGREDHTPRLLVGIKVRVELSTVTSVRCPHRGSELELSIGLGCGAQVAIAIVAGRLYRYLSPS